MLCHFYDQVCREQIFTLQIVDKVILEKCLSAHSIEIRELQLHKLEKGVNKSIPSTPAGFFAFHINFAF